MHYFCKKHCILQTDQNSRVLPANSPGTFLKQKFCIARPISTTLCQHWRMVWRHLLLFSGSALFHFFELVPIILGCTQRTGCNNSAAAKQCQVELVLVEYLCVERQNQKVKDMHRRCNPTIQIFVKTCYFLHVGWSLEDDVGGYCNAL